MKMNTKISTVLAFGTAIAVLMALLIAPASAESYYDGSEFKVGPFMYDNSPVIGTCVLSGDDNYSATATIDNEGMATFYGIPAGDYTYVVYGLNGTAIPGLNGTIAVGQDNDGDDGEELSMWMFAFIITLIAFIFYIIRYPPNRKAEDVPEAPVAPSEDDAKAEAEAVETESKEESKEPEESESDVEEIPESDDEAEESDEEKSG